MVFGKVYKGAPDQVVDDVAHVFAALETPLVQDDAGHGAVLGEHMIAEAREHGDLSENAEYHAAKERQSFIEGQIAELEDTISRSEVIDVSKLSGDTVKFGATVKLVDIETDEEKSTLEELGCGLLQGYLLGRPGVGFVH